MSFFLLIVKVGIKLSKKNVTFFRKKIYKSLEEIDIDTTIRGHNAYANFFGFLGMLSILLKIKIWAALENMMKILLASVNYVY